MKNNDKMGDMSGNGSAMTGEPKTAEEALALHKELLERENALLSENAELWEKVFRAADKGMTMQEDGKNYGTFPQSWSAWFQCRGSSPASPSYPESGKDVRSSAADVHPKVR